MGVIAIAVSVAAGLLLLMNFAWKYLGWGASVTQGDNGSPQPENKPAQEEAEETNSRDKPAVIQDAPQISVPTLQMHFADDDDGDSSKDTRSSRFKDPEPVKARPDAGLMAPPKLGFKSPSGLGPPLRSINGPNLASSLRAPPRTSTKPKPVSKQVALQPGHSPLDWARLQRSGANLRGVPPGQFLRVSKAELKRHNKRDDAWTALGGRVYNITAYMPFHPGGEKELMRAAGRDGTQLFQEIHSWINWDTMLEQSLIGPYVGEQN
jgi:cytochrome b involved in lipid metabolism